MKIESKNGIVLCSGSIGNIKLKKVGDKQTKLAEFGVLYGKGEDGKALYANFKAWVDLADIVATIPDKTKVFVIGGAKEVREYNGKNYENYPCEFIVGASGSDKMIRPFDIINSQNSISNLAVKDDEELPF